MRDLAALVVLGCLFVFPSMFSRDLWDPDEPRYMEVAREMVEIGGDAWIVPRLNGVLYAEKPPLFFWFSALLYRLGLGLNAGRMTAGLASIGTLVLTYLLARRFWPAPAPLLAGLASLTFLSGWKMRKGVIDPFLAFLSTAALYCAVRAMHREGRAGGAWWLGFYAAVGCGILTKGHVMLLVAAAPIILYGILCRPRLPGGVWRWHLAGVVLLLLVVAAWLVPAGVGGGIDYLESLTIGQLTRRVVASHDHRSPFYYYIGQYPLHFSPWFLLFIPAVALAIREWRAQRHSGSLLALIWFVALFVAFTCISGKREGYLLPLVPAFGLLVGAHLGRGLCGSFYLPRATVRLFVATFIVGALFFMVAGAAIVIVWFDAGLADQLQPKMADSFDVVRAESAPALAVLAAATAAGIGVVAAICALLCRRPGRLRVSIIATVVLSLAVSLHADLLIVPLLNPLKSGRIFCRQASPFLGAGVDVYLFPQHFSGMYNLYTSRVSMPVLTSERELLEVLKGSRAAAVICDGRALRHHAPDVVERYQPVMERRMGHRRMVVLANHGAPTAVEAAQ